MTKDPSSQTPSTAPAFPKPIAITRSLTIPLRTVHSETLDAWLTLPEDSENLVILVQANKSRQQTLINKWVSFVLKHRGIGSLLLDLVPRNGLHRRFQFDVMTQRLELTTRWLFEQPGMTNLQVGYFGVSIGAGAAMKAAAAWGERIGAVVSVGGRPDFAHEVLADITAPALFIVGERDPLTLDLNKDAAAQMRCPNKLVIVEGASHLFTEPGAISKVGELALNWFRQHLHVPEKIRVRAPT